MSDQNKIQTLIHDLVTKSWENEEFKNKLVSSPEQTIKEFSGEGMAFNSPIKVYDQTDSNTIFINIPRKVNVNEMDDLQLTDEQLEAISGGLTPAVAYWTINGILLGANMYLWGNELRD